MKTEEALYSQLFNDSTVTSIVSTRIYPVIAPQDASYPCVVYQRVYSEPVHAMANDAVPRKVSMTIVAIAKTYSAVKSLQVVLEDSIKDFSGTFGGVGGMAVDRVFLENISDDYDFDVDVYLSIMDFTIWAREG